MDMVIKEQLLTPVEQGRLFELEELVRENSMTYIVVGSALMEIRESRLYRNNAC